MKSGGSRTAEALQSIKTFWRKKPPKGVDEPVKAAPTSVTRTEPATATLTPTTPPKKKKVVVVDMAPSAPTQPKITNLCKSLDSDGAVSPSSTPACVGFIGDESTDNQCYIYPKKKLAREQLTSVSLGQIIDEPLEYGLTTRNRIFLAMTLASSFLQLLDSPWIQEYWTKADIIFFPDHDHSSVLLLDKPHVGRESALNQEENIHKHGNKAMDSGDKPADGDAGSSPSLIDRRQRSLTRLGVVLEELCFGQNLDRHPARKRLGKGETKAQQLAFDMVAALQWRSKIHFEAGGLYFSEAIGWCLVDPCQAVPDQDSWRKEMLRHVVGPLEQCFREFERSCGM